MDKFAPRFFGLAEANPADPIALEALTQVVRVVNSVDSLDAAIGKLIQEAEDDPKKVAK